MSDPGTNTLFRLAAILAWVTIGYNVVEGLVSVYFGLTDETITLFGFGMDSFIETISAIGIAFMITRIRQNPNSLRGPFEVRALRLTGWCFYALAMLLLITAILSVVSGHEPVSTVAGVVISVISIGTMWLLIRFKMRTGRKLNSDPIIADARCNLVCLYMSVILLISSGLWWWLQIPYVDAAGALGLVWFSYSEGKEAFEKAQGIDCGCEH